MGIGALPRLLLPLPGFQLLCGDCHMTVICVTQVCHCKVEELTLPEPDGRVDVLVSTELSISCASVVAVHHVGRCMPPGTAQYLPPCHAPIYPHSTCPLFFSVARKNNNNK